jgi:predicted NUDIX family NTP pyrophosphohydrolase
VWTIPKGELEQGEDLLAAAVREFEEEVGIKPHGPYAELGSIRQKGGKTVHAWAFAGDHDESQPIRSNRVQIEWPPGSGVWADWPEIDRAGFFSIPAARERLKISQHPLLDRLVQSLAGTLGPHS